jgi:hypothetical protein
MVGKVHSRVQRFRHGIPPEEMGGTKLDNNGTAALFTDWPVCYSPRQRDSVMRLVGTSY